MTAKLAAFVSMFLSVPLPMCGRIARLLCPVSGTNCYSGAVPNRTEPRTLSQWICYVVVAAIALYLIWWMLRLYVL